MHLCIPIDSELQWEKGIWKSFPFERIQLNRFIVTCGFEPSFRSTPIACRRNGWIFNLFGDVFYSVCEYISTHISHHLSNSFFSICVTYFRVIITYSLLRKRCFVESLKSSWRSSLNGSGSWQQPGIPLFKLMLSFREPNGADPGRSHWVSITQEILCVFIHALGS